jgi:Lipocalin-like domain
MDAKLAAGKEQILGTWKLTSFDLVTDEAHGSKQIAQPLGPTPLGRVTFDSDGFMSCLLTHPDNAKPLKTPWQLASDEDISFVARTMTAYCGPYKVLVEEGEIRLSTEVEVALDPSWIGSAQVRRVTLRKEAGKGILVLKPVQSFQLHVGSITQKETGTKTDSHSGWNKTSWCSCLGEIGMRCREREVVKEYDAGSWEPGAWFAQASKRLSKLNLSY